MYGTLFYSIENPEQRVAFYQVNESMLPEGWLAEKKIDKLTVVPKFVIMHQGSVKKVIDGVKFVELDKEMNAHLPQDAED